MDIDAHTHAEGHHSFTDENLRLFQDLPSRTKLIFPDSKALKKFEDFPLCVDNPAYIH